MRKTAKLALIGFAVAASTGLAQAQVESLSLVDRSPVGVRDVGAKSSLTLNQTAAPAAASPLGAMSSGGGLAASGAPHATNVSPTTGAMSLTPGGGSSGFGALTVPAELSAGLSAGSTQPGGQNDTNAQLNTLVQASGASPLMGMSASHSQANDGLRSGAMAPRLGNR